MPLRLCSRLLLPFAAAILIGSLARATVLTFDELPLSYPDVEALAVPAGYGGFTWSGFNYLDGLNNRANPSGYGAGVVSGQHVAFNAFGDPASLMISNSAPFTFNGAYLTAAWNDGLSVRVQGFNNQVQTYDTIVNPIATAPTFFAFDYENVDELRFSSFGGTMHPGYNGRGVHFVIDNFTFSVVPEPSTGLLVIGGLLGLADPRRVRSASRLAHRSHTGRARRALPTV